MHKAYQEFNKIDCTSWLYGCGNFYEINKLNQITY